MRRFRRIRLFSTAALLTVFVAGGVLVPFLHQAHQGHVSAQQYADAPDACDHKRHGDSFEILLTDIAHHDCLLCVRLLQVGDPQTTLQPYNDFSTFRASSLLIAEASHVSFISIRGPPGIA